MDILLLFVVIVNIALAVYTRSPAAYDALKSFKLLQLPCVRTLKHYIDSNLEEAGEVEKRLVDKKTEYDRLVSLHKDDLRARRKEDSESENFCEVDVDGALPIGEGSLILDEVKV